MSRILTGIQSSGRPHLGNLLGAIIPAIKLSQDTDNECLFFIADLHALISIKDANERIRNTLATAAAWLAFGLDTNKNLLYRQSRVPQVCELTWYLSCYTPFPMLANAHSFKDKADRLSDVNGGLFNYPVLMAADIILYDAHYVPVGKDQQQHLEMTRDIAGSMNHQYENLFVIPEAKIDEKVMVIPGTDGQKMSKSYGNTIDIFLPENELKRVIMSIVTDSIPLDDPKDPDKCNVFALYSLLAAEQQVETMRRKYVSGGYGFGQAKHELFELILTRFQTERERYLQYEENPKVIEDELRNGEKRAGEIADQVLNRVRAAIGYQ